MFKVSILDVICREIITFEMLCLESEINFEHSAIIKHVYFMQLHIRYTYEMPAFEMFPSFAYNPVRILPKDNLSTSLKIWQTML